MGTMLKVAEFAIAAVVMTAGVLLGWYGTMLTLGLTAITALLSVAVLEVMRGVAGSEGDAMMFGPLVDLISFVSLVLTLVALVAWVTAGLRFLFVISRPVGTFFRS
ncbi:MAG: hypothetical protein IT406_01065 [Candidatus Yanofskybacteria bacterium]|nr:hypothetical protein [Candidatus Yanofskybacteria bacterium]